jgi:short subunit dehydrogenase-like uncharacterized protein
MALAATRVKDIALLRVAASALTIASRGSFRTAVRLAAPTVIVRRDGVVRRSTVGAARRRFDFGEGERLCLAVSGPEVVTGEHTTGVGSIESYLEAPPAWGLAYRSTAFAAGVWGSGPVRRALEPLAAGWPRRPSARNQSAARCCVVVEAVDSWRRTTRIAMRTLDGYSVTTETALAVVERILAGAPGAGFQTPAGCFGPDLLATLPGVRAEGPQDGI